MGFHTALYQRVKSTDGRVSRGSKLNWVPDRECDPIALSLNANCRVVHGLSSNRADLTDAHLFRVKLTKISLQDADLTGVNLRHAALSNADLAVADLSDANFIDADLPAASLSSVDLSGADLTGAFFPKELNTN